MLFRQSLNSILPGLSQVLGAAKQIGATGKPVAIGLTPVSMPTLPRGGGGGASAARGAARSAGTTRISEEQRTAQQLAQNAEQSATRREELERNHQETLADIAQSGARKRQEAESNLHQARLQGSASFYHKLVTMQDQQQAQELDRAYQQIEQETQALATQQGADVATAYREKAMAAAEAQAQIAAEIREAQEAGNTALASNLQRVLAMQQESDRQALESIKNQGSAIAAEQAKRYADEEQAYRAHLDRMLQDYQEKVGKLGGTPGLPPPTALPTAGSVLPRPPASAGAASPTIPGTSGSAPVQVTGGVMEVTSATLTNALQEVRDRLGAIEQVINRGDRDIVGAVRGLKSASPFKP